jgi:putative membrane protein
MTASDTPRKPRVFAPDDPSLEVRPASTIEPQFDPTGAQATVAAEPAASWRRRSSLRWGALFLSAVASLGLLTATVAFTGFVAEAMARNDWVGWLATALAAIATVSLAVIVVREVIGIFRLGRLARLRQRVTDALKHRDVKAERAVLADVAALYGGRAEHRWALARLNDHAGDVRDPGDLLALAERELLVPLDSDARRLVLKSAKRVSVVTALSPMVWIAMIYVLVENLRLLRMLAGLYGGRPGTLGALRLARMVFTHILATGGLALTDDLFGQFLGQDLLRRLSRRLGEGVFNGALTARIGVAAVEVIRPLPFLEATPIRIRDLLPELLRKTAAPQGGKSPTLD